MKQNASLPEIKALLKEHGYQFNRWWRIDTSLGHIINSKLGGWNGLELSISGGAYKCLQMLRNMGGAELATIYNTLEKEL